MSSNVPQNKLRDLIRNLRQCKTEAEENYYLQRAKAAIAYAFSQNEEESRARNIAKLLFINMMGHETDFV